MGLGGIEVSLRQGDLVVGNVIDNVGAADEGIAHDGCASTCGADAEDAGWRAIFKRDWASTGVRAGVKDELLHGNRDDRRGKGKIDGGGVVHQRAWNVSCSCSRVVLSSYLVEDCLGDLVG